jgi:tryptophan-rich sensory protein
MFTGWYVLRSMPNVAWMPLLAASTQLAAATADGTATWSTVLCSGVMLVHHASATTEMMSCEFHE